MNICIGKMDDECVNILLLGETGTGKSTFINSFANYLQFKSLGEAEESKLICVIPAKFSITSEDGELVEVHFNKDSNEDSSIGSSSTQDAKAYNFPFRNASVRIIDTPGINDSRGAVTKDAENLEGILRCIQKYKQLHAVCFLLKPDVTVLTATFKYCLLELLSRLDRSAALNIIFVFTRTRSTDYLAPDTLGCLRKLVSDVAINEGVNIPLRFKKADRRNCFFLDNEGFKYLVARQKGLSMGSANRLKESWEVSQEASWRMMDYILGDKDHPGLLPHNIQDTVSINFARQLIFELSQPLQDMNQFVQESIDAIENHKRELQDESLSNEELQKKLYVPYLDLEQIELVYPVTVCTASGCTETLKIAGITKQHYKQRCHDPCYLPSNALRHINYIGDMQLWLCCEMIDWKGSCKRCGCGFTKHMTIYYETRTVEAKKLDETVQAEVWDKEKLLRKKAEVLADAEKESQALKSEQNTIALALAKFAYFLRKNSICPINDAYEDYLDCLIKNESKVQAGKQNKDLIDRYRTMKEEHIRQKKLLEEAEKQAKERNVRLVTSDEIVALFRKLTDLPRTGKKIAALYERVTKINAEKEENVHKPSSQSRRRGKDSSDSAANIRKSIEKADVQEAMAQMKKYVDKQSQGASGGDFVKERNSQEAEAIRALISDNPLSAVAKVWSTIDEMDDPSEMMSLFKWFESLMIG